MDGSKLRELNLTNDEIGGLEKAFSNNKFRDLFAQYLKEMQDPENQKTFEREIIELEKQRGNDVLLIKPVPYYVLKSSVDGQSKAYINFACSDNVNKINYLPAQKASANGCTASIPYSLSPVRQTRDKSNRQCNVYCVVFHPSTLECADTNSDVKKAVQETAFSAVEKSFKVQLDKVNIRASKKRSKGPLEMTMVKRNGTTDSSDTLVTDGESNRESSSATVDTYITPAYNIKYREEVDLQNSTTDKYCKMNSLIPNQIIIDVNLPLLKSIRDTKLNVLPTSVELTNEDPKYKLLLTLPYEVNEDTSSAKFNADSRVLTLHLDVRKKLERAKSHPLIEEISDTRPAVSLNNLTTNLSRTTANTREITLLSAKVKYKLPEYICYYHNNTLAFTLRVKNVVESSFESVVFDKADGFWVKFYSLGNGQFPMNYSMRIGFAEALLKPSDALHHVIEGDNLFVYAHLNKGCPPLEYMVGVDENSSQKVYLNEMEAIKLKFENEKQQNANGVLEVTEIDADKVVINMKPRHPVPAPKKSVIEKEELFFNDHSFGGICDGIRTRFTLDEQGVDKGLASLSGSAVLVGSAHSELLRTHSDGENGSWITQKLIPRKLRKKKKVREKTSLIEESIIEDDAAEVVDSATDSVDETRDCEVFSKPVDIRSAYRFSDLSGRSILKKSRSFSESSGDECFYIDYSRSYSVDEINSSSDSYCHVGCKKTVTFNDVISKKLFSSDISILEQRKRQRRHSRRKAGRASDSENSETETSEGGTYDRRENIRAYNESLMLETGSETDLTSNSSLSESGGETSDDQSEPSEGIDSNGVLHKAKKPQPVPSSKKGHKRRGKKSARKNASTAKHQHHEDALV